MPFSGGTMEYPIDAIRRKFPALNRIYRDRGVVFFDGPSGTQVVQSAIDSMVRYMEQGSANLGGEYITGKETIKITSDAREAMADMLGGKPSEIAFGMNMTSLTFDISRALSRNWTEEDSIVVTELDHRANVDTWITAAEEKGTEVRWIKLDEEALTLDLFNLDEIITKNTKLVAIGHASNGVGTINNVTKIAARAKEMGALVMVDAVHSAPHVYIDRDDMGADIVICSAYKFFGPHIGVASIKEDVFKELQPYRITTAASTHPAKLETGTQSFEGLGGVIGAVDFIASLGEGDTRRARIQSAFNRIRDHENHLATRLRSYLTQHDKVTLYQADDSIDKTPTVAFRVEGMTPAEVCAHLDTHAIFAGDGHFYAKTIGELLGLNDTGGWVRIGMAPYNSRSDVDSFITAMNALLIQ